MRLKFNFTNKRESTKSNAANKDGFVAASPSHALRDGEGTFFFKQGERSHAPPLELYMPLS